MRLLTLACVIVLGCGGEEEPDDTAPEPTPCERLRTHLVELRLAGAPSIDSDAHRAAQIAAMGNDFLVACGNLTDRAVECALDADDIQVASACASAGASK